MMRYEHIIDSQNEILALYDSDSNKPTQVREYALGSTLNAILAIKDELIRHRQENIAGLRKYAGDTLEDMIDVISRGFFDKINRDICDDGSKELFDLFLYPLIKKCLYPTNENEIKYLCLIEEYLGYCLNGDFTYFTEEYFTLFADGYNLSLNYENSFINQEHTHFNVKALPAETIKIMDLFSMVYAPSLNYKMCRIYKLDSLSQICIASLSEIFKQGLTVKRCLNCQNIFVPKRYDALFCNEISPQNPKLTCKKYCKALNERDIFTSHSKLQEIYNKIFTEKSALIMNEPDVKKRQALISDQMIFVEKTKEYRKKIPLEKEAGFAEAEYLKWLQENDK